VHRIAPKPLELDQVVQTLETLESMSDEGFATWLLETAEPWQQSLLFSVLLKVVRAVEGLTEPNSLIEAIALQMRDSDSLRTVLAAMLRPYLCD
jgi:hypothetical protein